MGWRADEVRLAGGADGCEPKSGEDRSGAPAGLPAVARVGEVSERVGGSNSVVESQPSKLLVAGSIPVSRSILRWRLHLRPRATVGQPTFALRSDGTSGLCLVANKGPTRRP